MITKIKLKLHNLYLKLLVYINKLQSLHGKYIYENRRTNAKEVCIILAGYKEILWDTVFKRCYKFVPADVDVLIVSPGMYSSKLSKIAKDNSWSYLSVSRNNLCLAQNIAIKICDDVEFFYKLDEDMFITNGFFECMRATYQHAEKNSRYDVGFVAPLIPINGYGYVRLLEKFDKINDFEMVFGPAKYTGGNSDVDNFTKDLNIPKFFWQNITEFRDIDITSSILRNREMEYTICPIRFSIGAIYFKRDLWSEMGMFKVGVGNGLAQDEIQICGFCNRNSKVVVVSENNLVGHLCYGPQSSEMYKYYISNRNIFDIKD